MRVNLEIPPNIPLIAFIQAMADIGVEISYQNGELIGRPAAWHTNANVTRFPRYHRQLGAAHPPQPDGPEAA